ncbi:MAG: class I SAM-dependent methyltransferase [Chloroflexota bacterium]|nr:MAG: class I SAM-dependent methyltransferase [Chloroflexota bacterium]
MSNLSGNSSMSLRAKRGNLKVPSLPPRLLRHSVPRNDIRHCQFDIEWDDGQLFPEVIYPDADFLLRRMNEATLEVVNPRRDELILDIGCGRGIDGVELAKRGAVVIGLEPSYVMLKHAREHISANGANMSLVRGLGEYMPLRNKSVDKVVCKGALDHFPDPPMVMEQIALVLKPGGEATIAIANFESLGFKLGRMVWWFRKKLGFKAAVGRMLWEVPEDHTYRFDYLSLRRLVNEHLEMEKATGVSLFFGIPWWGILLSKLPRNISLAILSSLDKVARCLPSLSDVVVLRCRTKY